MLKQILFIQGAGEGAYEEDVTLAESLRRELGSDYEVVYPAMPNEADVPYDEWKHCIEEELAKMQEPVVIVAHSLGASVVLKSLGEIKLKKSVAGMFLMASPFWGGDGWRYEGYEELELPKDLATTLPRAPIFLYHCWDDDIVPFEHLALYKKLLPDAVLRQLDVGGHQFNNDLNLVAQDIKSLQNQNTTKALRPAL